MLLCCLVAEDEPGPVMFDKHVEKSLKGFVNYFIVLCLKSIQWAVCVNVGVYVFVRAANVCASGLWVITKAPQWRSSDILLLRSASPCCAFPFTPTESWQTLTSSYTPHQWQSNKHILTFHPQNDGVRHSPHHRCFPTPTWPRTH